MRPSILVVQHQDTCPPGWVGDWLVEAGLDLDVIKPYDGDDIPRRLDHDGLLVLGGSMGANDDAAYPYLTDVKRLLAHTSADGTPTLGICLGHQLLAVACGGRVEPYREGQQAGVRRIAPRPGAGSDPLHRVVPDDAVGVQWNDDVVIAMPPGGSMLAANALGVPLAIRTGERAWGVQFHPEVGAAIVAAWADGDVAEGRMTRVRADAHLAEIRSSEARLIDTWRPWAQRFAEIVAAYAPHRRSA